VEKKVFAVCCDDWNTTRVTEATQRNGERDRGEECELVSCSWELGLGNYRISTSRITRGNPHGTCYVVSS
jgi:hypothetical protein